MVNKKVLLGHPGEAYKPPGGLTSPRVGLQAPRGTYKPPGGGLQAPRGGLQAPGGLKNTVLLTILRHRAAVLELYGH